MNARTYRGYLLALLFAILTFNYVDRLVVGLVTQDLKAALNLTDTQIGLLGGLAYAVFYSIMGIPIARWADRGNRVTLIFGAVTLWSLAMALTGLVRKPWELFFVRIGSAVGEASCIPPSLSLIADYFDRAHRPRAVAIYMLGGPFSGFIGYFLAGWINQLFGWRVTFAAVGAPGLLLGVLALLTLTEPRRNRTAKSAAHAPETLHHLANPVSLATSQPSLWTVLTVLRTTKSLRHLVTCFIVASFFGYAMLQWQPTFYVRTFGLSTGELGTWLTLVTGVVGLFGTLLGGEFASRWAPRNERAQLRAAAIGYCGYGIFLALAYLSRDYHAAFLWTALASLSASAAYAPVFATLQTLVPESMRATSVAVMYLLANLLGMGLGPLATGALSDLLRPWVYEQSLRYALVILAPGTVWAGFHVWEASKSVATDIQTTGLEHERSGFG